MFYKANIVFLKHRKTKRIYIQAGRVFNIRDILGLIEQKKGGIQQLYRRLLYEDELEARPATLQCYKQCGKIEYNIRTYQEVEEILDEESDIEFN